MLLELVYFVMFLLSIFGACAFIEILHESYKERRREDDEREKRRREAYNRIINSRKE